MLVELTLGEPAGLAPIWPAPQVTSWTGLLRGYLRASHRRRWVVRCGSQAPALSGTALCCTTRHDVSRRRWEQFLTASLQAGAPGGARTG